MGYLNARAGEKNDTTSLRLNNYHSIRRERKHY